MSRGPCVDSGRDGPASVTPLRLFYSQSWPCLPGGPAHTHTLVAHPAQVSGHRLSSWPQKRPKERPGQTGWLCGHGSVPSGKGQESDKSPTENAHVEPQGH